MKYLKQFKIFESNLLNDTEDILQAISDMSTGELTEDSETTYRIGYGDVIYHYEYEINSIVDSKDIIVREIKRVESKLHEYGYFSKYIIDEEMNKLFIAFIPNDLNVNWPSFYSLRQVDDIKSYYRFDNGNDIFVWDLEKVVDNIFGMSDLRYEVEDSLNEDLWRTNSPLIITFCMWNNHRSNKIH